MYILISRLETQIKEDSFEILMKTGKKINEMIILLTSLILMMFKIGFTTRD